MKHLIPYDIWYDNLSNLRDLPQKIGFYFINLIKNNTLVFIILIIITFGVVKAPFFFTVENVRNLTSSIPIEGIVAVGMTFVILSSGFDLSVGSVMALVTVIMTYFLNAGYGVLATLLVSLLLGAGIGMINGLGVAKARLSPFIVTLATMISLRGLALILTNGYVIAIDNPPPFIDQFAWTSIGPISLPFFLFVGIILIAGFILRYTNFGRSIYAIGGNIRIAQLAGIIVNVYLISVYVISGVLCSIAAIISLSLSSAANPMLGQWTNLDTIAMVCIGGNNIFGGQGSIWRTLVGILLLGIIANILDLMGIAPWYKEIIVAIIILIAVSLAPRSTEGL